MYEKRFGFEGRPFQLSPDPAFFYASRGHQRAMSYLEYGMHQGEGFIVVTGDVGAGKTTLLRSLIGRIPSDRIVAAQIVSTQLEAEDLVRMVARAFGLPDARGDKAAVLHRLERYFRELSSVGRRALLIVDEAQNLPPRALEELRMLSNFQAGGRAPLQAFLVGQPEFRSVMQQPSMQQLRQRIIASYHLGPLEADECRAYVEHRLHRVGWDGQRPAIDAEAFTALHAASGGVPRRINLLFDRALLAAHVAERETIGAADVAAVAAELEEELGPQQVAAAAVPASAPAPAPAESGRPSPHELQALAQLAAMRAKLTSIEWMFGQLYDALKRQSPRREAGAAAHGRGNGHGGGLHLDADRPGTAPDAGASRRSDLS